HTSLGYFNQEDKILPVKLRFPVEARFIDSRLYISDPLVNDDQLTVGDEILSINGKSVSEIKAGIYKHISSDGHNEGFPKEIINAYFTAIIAYYFGFPKRFEIVITDRKKPVLLRQLNQYKYKPRVNPEDKCQDNLCFEIMSKKRIAKLTVRSFAYYGNRFNIFKTFVDRSFDEIASSGIKNLIVDVRLNPGGSDAAGSYLLEHIANRPFTYFAEASAGSDQRKRETRPSKYAFGGRTYILIDGNGTSTTGHFLSLVKSNEFATLIGEEAGATYTVNDNSKSFKLTNTGISYKVARNTFFTTANHLPKGRGVLPDHHISQNITDFVNRTDTALNYTIALILKNKDD
ncbi:MAG: peptidase S41, partial [Pyrinomonadaceae bacterium]|nr:peptidase S41 [Pyrinomonadaceae bacterium]